MEELFCGKLAFWEKVGTIIVFSLKSLEIKIKIMVNIPILNLTHHHHKDIASLRNVSQSANYEEDSYPQSLK